MPSNNKTDLPLVSVVVPTYHSWDGMWQCLMALRSQTYPNFEVLVVNNAPSDSCSFQQQLRSNERVINEEKPGSYAARNRGIDESIGEYVAFTDADCIPAKDWIESAVKVLCSDSSVIRATGPVDVYRSPESTALAWRLDKVVAFNQLNYVSQGLSVTANLVVKRVAFAKVGLFNAELYSGGDMEWNSRAQSSGLPIIYSKDVCVNHPCRSSLGEIIKKKRRTAAGSAIQSMHSNQKTKLICRSLAPPIRAFSFWVQAGHKWYDIGLAFFMTWAIKLLSITEMISVMRGNAARRS